LAYFCFNESLRLSPSFCVLSQYLEPVIGIFIGVLFFQESLTAIQLVGSLLIIGSVAIAEYKSRGNNVIAAASKDLN